MRCSCSMILLEQKEEEQEEMLLPLCLTGFCYAEAGNDATHLKLTLESLIHVTTLFIVRTIFIHQPPL